MPSEKSRRFFTRLSGWRLGLMRLAMAVGIPLLLGLALEGALRVCDYGYATTFFIPAGDGVNERINDHFTAPYFPPDAEAQSWPVLLPLKKPAGTLRIFILGESAAHGTPDPSFGFARILEVMLRRQHPEQHFEVVNAALRGINSHLILPIARECAAREPDLFIAYMGNNEVTGLYAPEPGAMDLTGHLRLLRLMRWAQATRTAQLFKAVLHRGAAAPGEATQEMPFFRKRKILADDPRKVSISENLRQNLQAVCNNLIASSSKAIISTVAVNLRDCPPLGSLHRSDLSQVDTAHWEALYAEGVTAEAAREYDTAIARYLAAALIDDHFADLHFRLARCLEAARRTDEARAQYALACDWDALQFRTDSHLNAAIREIAANREATGLFLADAAEAFAQSPSSAAGAPGDRLFYEHVHLRFDGDYLLAQTLLPRVVRSLALGASAHPIPSRDECAAALAYNDWDELDMLAAVAQATARPPFVDQLDHSARQAQAEKRNRDRLSRFGRADMQRALVVVRNAVQQSPDDWQLRFILGRMLYAFQDYAGAVEPLENTVRLMPYHTPVRLLLADSLAKTGRPNQARQQLQDALRFDPQSPAIRAALEQTPPAN